MKNKTATPRRRTKNLALASILCALGVVLLLLSSVVEVLDLTLCAFASFLVALTVIELGSFWPYLVYLVTGVLSALLVPNKFAAVVYILFAGIYPIFKEMFERLHYVITWLLKFSFFNMALLLVVLFSVYILHLEDTGMAYKISVMLLGNGAFLLYDIALSKIIQLYIIKLRRMLGLKNYFDNN